MKNDFFGEEIRGLMDMVLKSMYMLDREIEASFGITSARVFTLLAFAEKEMMKMKELSETMSLTSSTMTRMIDNLVKDGLVERKHELHDRRLVLVRLTNSGKRLTNNIKEYKERYFDSIIEHIEKDGKEEMISSLKTLLDAFERYKSGL